MGVHNGKYETRCRQKDVDWYGLYRNDLPCLYASMSPVSDIYVILQENLLVWHKISKCTTPQEQNCNHSPQKALWEFYKKERPIWNKAFKAKKKRKEEKTLIESSWKVKESPLNCNRTSICYGDVCFIGINRLRNQIKQRRSYQMQKSTYKEASPNKWAHFQPPCDLGRKGQASPLEQTRFMPEGTQGSSRPVLKCQTCCFGWMEWCNCCWVCKERRRKQVIKEMN